MSGVVGDEAAGGAAEVVVERDCGCECEQALADACSEAVEGAGAVAFEREEVFAGPEDALDSLTDRGQVRPAAGLVLAAGADDQRLTCLHRGVEALAGVALVADHRDRAGARQALDQLQTDLALVGLRGGERDRAWGSVKREESVQSEAPEVATVAAAVPVVGRVAQRAATDRLDRARALDRVESTTSRSS